MSNSYQIGNIKGERLPDAGRRLTHPSGVVADEPSKARQVERAMLVAEIKQAQERLAEFDADEATLQTLTPIAIAVVRER